MDITRRGTMVGAMVAAAMPGVVRAQDVGDAMYGLIGKIKAVAGERETLVALLIDGADAMPGCLSYVVALDASDEDVIWVTEVWDSEASHRASLSLPAVRAAIADARPLIDGFETGAITAPVGGVGLDGGSDG